MNIYSLCNVRIFTTITIDKYILVNSAGLPLVKICVTLTLFSELAFAKISQTLCPENREFKYFCPQSV